MQNQNDLSEIKKTLGLNPNEVDLIASLYQKKGIYSECFLMAGQNRSVALIEASPKEFWLSTTDPRDLAQIEKQKNEHPDWTLDQIIEHLSQKYPRGVVHS